MVKDLKEFTMTWIIERGAVTGVEKGELHVHLVVISSEEYYGHDQLPIAWTTRTSIEKKKSLTAALQNKVKDNFQFSIFSFKQVTNKGHFHTFVIFQRSGQKA